MIDRFSKLIGDLHRPFAVIVTSIAAAVATVVLAFRVEGDGSAFMWAVYGGLAVIYGARSLENFGAAKVANQGNAEQAK